MVSLNVSLPPIEEPTSTSEYTTVKPFLRNENSSDSSFTVVLEREQRAATTRVSDGLSPHHDRCEDRHDRDRGQCRPCG